MPFTIDGVKRASTNRVPPVITGDQDAFLRLGAAKRQAASEAKFLISAVGGWLR